MLPALAGLGVVGADGAMPCVLAPSLQAKSAQTKGQTSAIECSDRAKQ
jgi:hypothetical protein